MWLRSVAPVSPTWPWVSTVRDVGDAVGPQPLLPVGGEQPPRPPRGVGADPRSQAGHRSVDPEGGGRDLDDRWGGGAADQHGAHRAHSRDPCARIQPPPSLVLGRFRHRCRAAIAAENGWGSQRRSGGDDPFEELGRAGVLRRAEHLLGRAHLGDDPGIEEADPVGDLAGERHLVGREHHRHAFAGELSDQFEHARDQLGVERARDLVEQHQLRSHREGPHDRDPLLLTARESVGVLVLASPTGRSVRGASWRAARPLPRLESPRTLRGARVTFFTTVMCGKRLNAWKTMPTSPTEEVELGFVLGHGHPVDDDRSRLDGEQAVDAAQQRALARAGRTDEAHDLVFGDVEVDPLEHLVVRRTASTPVGSRAVPCLAQLPACMRSRSRRTSHSVSRVIGMVMARYRHGEHDERRVGEAARSRRCGPGHTPRGCRWW